MQIDVTNLIEGHSSYLWATQDILERLELDSYYPTFTYAPIETWEIIFPYIRGKS